MDKHITDLIPAYALDSLDREDQLMAEMHLQECEVCKAELRAYIEVVGELAYAVKPVAPPDKLKKQIMNRVQSEIDKGQEQAGDSWWQRFVNLSKSAAPVWVVASLLLIIFLGASNLFLLSEVNSLNQEYQPVNLPVINLYGTDIEPDATGVLVVSADGEHGTLIVDRVPVLDESMQYQLWLIKDGTRVSGGVFSVSDEGYGALWVDSQEQLTSYNAFGITMEPDGGSPGPTGEKILGSDQVISSDL